MTTLSFNGLLGGLLGLQFKVPGSPLRILILGRYRIFVSLSIKELLHIVLGELRTLLLGCVIKSMKIIVGRFLRLSKLSTESLLRRDQLPITETLTTSKDEIGS